MKKKLFCGIIAATVFILAAINVNFALTGEQNLGLFNLSSIESLAQELIEPKDGCDTYVTVEEAGSIYIINYNCKDGYYSDCQIGNVITDNGYLFIGLPPYIFYCR